MPVRESSSIIDCNKKIDATTSYLIIVTNTTQGWCIENNLQLRNWWVKDAIDREEEQVNWNKIKRRVPTTS